MGRMLFCRVGWMKRYEDKLEEDPIHGGGSYVDKHGYGHEIYNFLRDDQGNLYGFVEAGSNKMSIAVKMAIERLEAKSSDESVSQVLVIWVAAPPRDSSMRVVGWYKNATVFRRVQSCPQHLNGQRSLPDPNDHWGFRIAAKQKDAVLLPEGERTFEIAKAKGGCSGMGQKNIWYADALKDQKLRQEVLNYISRKGSETSASQGKKAVKTTPYQPDIEKRHQVELAAMSAVESWYARRGWKIEDVSSQNIGWDIEATREGSFLRIEVKGFSASNIAFDLTPREYEQLLANVDSYRVCVVPNALENKPIPHPLTYNASSKEFADENHKLRLQLKERVGARVG